MKKSNTRFLKRYDPLLVGFFTVVMTVIFGMTVAFALGLTTPAQVFAQLAPPCCALPPSTPPLLPPPLLPPPPIVSPVPTCTLSASPASLPYGGGSSTLSWTTVAATGATIDNGIGSVSASGGSQSVSVTGSANYTMTVSGPGGQTTCTAGISVAPPPPPPVAPTCTLSASPTSIASGASSALSWTTTGASSFSIDNGIGAVTPVASGTHTVSPTATTAYTGTVTGAGGTAACTATVTVTSATSAVYGCMDKTATNYNPAATSQTGVTCTYPPASGGGGGGGAAAPTCALSVTPTGVTAGSASTLSWSGTDISNVDIDNGVAVATSSSGSVSVAPGSTTTYTGTFHATDGQALTCTATLTVAAPSGGGAGGGGAGGNGSASSGAGSGSSATVPTVTLASLPHLGKQPLAYLYLSQIPYTGLDLGPVGTTLYWLLLIAWSIVLSYVALFIAMPFVNRRARDFGVRVSALLNAPNPAPAIVPATQAAPAAAEEKLPEPKHHYSSFDGFKSFARDGALSIEDIVKGLSRAHATPIAVPVAAEEPTVAMPKVEPIYEHVEPVAEAAVEAVEPVAANAPPAERDLASALIMGDRTAVFAGLRRHMQGGGAPERLMSSVVCLLDDTYRSRIDGVEHDASVARLTARLDTPTLEKLVAALATAIDASYTDGATGAKLALTRALAVLGA